MIPTTEATYSYISSSSELTIQGMATDNVGVVKFSFLHTTEGGSSATTTPTFTASSTYSWSLDSNLSLGENIFQFTFYDEAGNVGTSSYLTISYATSSLDLTAPVSSSAAPSGALSAGTTNVNMSFITNEEAFCRYSTTAGTDFDAMTSNFDSSSTTAHSLAVGSLTNGSSYKYYIRCQDDFSNTNDADFTISFSVSSPVSSGGGGGGGGRTSYVSPVVIVEEYQGKLSVLSAEITETSVIVSWINPEDNDFKETVIVRTGSEVPSFYDYEALLALGEKVYEGDAESFTDTDVSQGDIYYYYIFSVNKDDEYSSFVVIKTGTTTQEDDDMALAGGNGYKYSEYKTLANVSSSIVEEVSHDEAYNIYNRNVEVDLNETSNRLYIFIITKSTKELNSQDKFAIAYFIHDGTPTTNILGAGERAGVINSYLSVFEDLPDSAADWKDVVKIANGRWPEQRNLEKEQAAEATHFYNIYQRNPNMDSQFDNAAVTVITYGLRPADRNMDSEKAAIKIFKNIFYHDPSSALDWDIVRAIAYSGATR